MGCYCGMETAASCLLRGKQVSRPQELLSKDPASARRKVGPLGCDAGGVSQEQHEVTLGEPVFTHCWGGF